MAVAPSDPGPICPVCREHRLVLLQNLECQPQQSIPSCDHAACEECWAQWAEEHLEGCRSHRTASVRCIGPECASVAVHGLWAHACTQSSKVQEVEQLLQRRHRLQQNALFPDAVQINCPQPRCVGLGYLGFDTAMCFICEHQWIPEDGTGEPPPETDVEVVMGVKVKRCPKCFEYIEKNGGCDHMTCRHRGCGHEFWWSTLKPYRDSV